MTIEITLLGTGSPLAEPRPGRTGHARPGRRRHAPGRLRAGRGDAPGGRRRAAQSA